MTRIAILTCATITHELGCSAVGCLSGVRLREGQFDRYPKDQPLDLVGIVSCAGCPAAIGPEKIRDRVRALVAIGAEAIHFSVCVTQLCPFKERYAEFIRQSFPNVALVMGTHAPGQGMTEAQTGEFIRRCVGEVTQTPRKTIVEVALEKMAPPVS